MTKMGIKEFRDRIASIAQGGDGVELTHHGRVVGTYTPKLRHDPVAAREAAESLRQWQDDLRAEGIEPEDWLKELGLDAWGAPLAPDDR